MDTTQLRALACPGVLLLIAFLSFSSQFLFAYTEPGPIRKGDGYIFNALVFALLVCYLRTCFTDPGRIPKDWQSISTHVEASDKEVELPLRQRFCRRCELPKPARAHHCKTCKRCVMKMDHHCVWTANCISHITFPHFLRFLFYAVAAMAYLEYFLYLRCAVIWQNRKLPSYLGPSVVQLSHLFVLTITNSLVLFALVLLLGRTIWGLALNTTTIEGWEIERHEALLRRARVMGGWLDGPDGTKVRIERQEFPWDIGIWANFCQGMGTSNPLVWLWPFAQSPTIKDGLYFEHNGIEDRSKSWPPPDPDRMFKAPRVQLSGDGFTQSIDKDAFRKRQEADLARYVDGEMIVRRRPFHERYEHLARKDGDAAYADDDAIEITDDEDDHDLPDSNQSGIDADAGEEAWRNKEGERLADFGLDEDAEFYDEDDIPLSELIRRRKEANTDI